MGFDQKKGINCPCTQVESYRNELKCGKSVGQPQLPTKNCAVICHKNA